MAALAEATRERGGGKGCHPPPPRFLDAAAAAICWRTRACCLRSGPSASISSRGSCPCAHGHVRLKVGATVLRPPACPACLSMTLRTAIAATVATQ